MIDESLMTKAYVEVLEILKYIPWEEYNKIPSELIENMQKNMDKKYTYKVTDFDNFQEQKMLKETETILAVMFQNYWATEEERINIRKKDQIELNILEEKKHKIYNPNNLFNKKNNQAQKTVNPISLVEYKESLFEKLKKFILNLLNKANKNF